MLDTVSAAGSHADVQRLRQKDLTAAKSLAKSNKTYILPSTKFASSKPSLRFVKGDDATKQYGMLAYYNEKKQINNNAQGEKSKFNPDYDPELQ